jgi:hypothetical protein
MILTTLILIGLLIVLFSLLIFATQRYSWARHGYNLPSAWPQISAGLSAILFIITVIIGIWFPQYVVIPAIALVISIAAPVFYNLYAVLKKRKG